VREDHDRRHHARRAGHRGAAGIHHGKAEDGTVTIAADVLRRGDNRRFGRRPDGRPARPCGRARACRPRCGLVASLGHRHRAGVSPAAGGLFSTGDEILSLGEPPREGAVYDSNRYTVFGLLTRLGCEVIDLGVVRDEPALLEAAFNQAASRPTPSSPAAA
jgi:molybdopterin molybdotransferase